MIDFLDCTPEQRIERWEQCLRVLESMPEHERLNHWNMARWGIKTECGTVACAAGHCALDPWFINQGLKLEFNLNSCACSECVESGISGKELAHVEFVERFFGETGSNDIFYNMRLRPVETVIDEIEAYIGMLGG